ncbi:restriction endonuclease subunit S [Embleya sp. NPDC005575]|uniref:restriction endonuclease subunit S n=1 Tax=Embleya sp. NPDC005575 TaxID=3156892 RepID=UPI0033B02C0E
MSERTVKLSELVGENLLEIGAGRPRSVDLDRYPLPILKVADVLDGKIESSFQDYVSEACEQVMGLKISMPGDIVLTTKGTVGRVAIMPAEGPRFAYSPQLCYFRPDANGPLKPRYMYYWFKSVDFWKQADALKGQTDMADFLSLGDIYSLKLRLPSLAQQASVVDILGALDDKIAVNERIASTMEELVLAVASSDRWERRVRLDEICALRKEQAAPQEMADAWVDHYSLPAFDAGKSPERVSPMSIKSSKFVVFAPAVLLSKLNPDIPRIWDVEPTSGIPALASTEFLVLGPRADLSTHELWAVVAQKGFIEKLASKVTGTSKSHQRVRPAEVLATEVVDPRQFGTAGQRIQSMARRAATARAESRTLAALRDTLLPQLMSGRLRVKDAEKIVEDQA